MPPPPAPGPRMPQSHSSTPSSTVLLRNPQGPATFWRSLTLVPTPPSGLRPPSWAPSPALSNPRLPPSPRPCFLARRPPRPPLLPFLLIWFPLVTLCRLRKARFTFNCFSCFPLVWGGFPLIYLFQFRARMWAWDRYGPQMKRFGP